MAEAIGVVSSLQGRVTAVDSSGVSRVLGEGDQVFDSDVLSVSAQGSNVDVTFNNGCKMSLKEGESALIDETLYKLEFFDNAELAMDVGAAEGVVGTAAEEELVDDIYLSETDESEIDLDAMEETAAGESLVSSQVDSSDGAETLPLDERGSDSVFESTLLAAGSDSVEDGDEFNIPEIPEILPANLPELPKDPTLPESPPEKLPELPEEPDTPEISPVDTLVLTIIDADSEGVIHLSGEAAFGMTVRVDVNEDSYSVVTGEDGSWSLQTDALSEGSFSLGITAIDATGSSSKTLYHSVMIDSERVTFTIQEAESTMQSYGLEQSQLFGIASDGGFDKASNRLSLSIDSEDWVAVHSKGYGVTGADQGESKALGGEEALVIRLDTLADHIEVTIDKLNVNEQGMWLAYDEQMQKVGEGLFGQNGSSYESGFFANRGTLSIDSDHLEAPFQYIVLTTDETLQGKCSSYFLEDISYEAVEHYHYDLSLNNIPLGENPKALYIDGLGDDLYLQNSDNSEVGTLVEGRWYLDAQELEDLMTLSGQLDLKIVSDTALDIEDLSPTVTLVETDFHYSDSTYAFNGGSLYFDFDKLEGIDLDHEVLSDQRLDLQEVMELSGNNRYLGIKSSEGDNQFLRLDADTWELKVDTQGQGVSLSSGDTSYAIYASTDVAYDYELLIDEKIAIILES